MTIKKFVLFTFWTLLIFVSAYFYYDNVIAYLFGYRNERFGETFFSNQFWFVSHMLGATCSLFLGPIQFWKSIRTKYLKFHRLTGKIYIIGTLIAAVSAFRLALIFDCVACRFSLIPLSLLLFVTTALAWYSIKLKNIVAHKQFMVRSYTCALAFVFVRLYQVIPLGFMFDVINEPQIQGIVTEWMFSILPLILVEIGMIWIPSIKSSHAFVK